MTRHLLSGPVGFAVVLGVLVAVALILPNVSNSGIMFLAGLTVIEIVFALAFNFLFSTVGILSFGQAVFVLFGAYGTAVGIKFADLSLIPALLTSGAVSAVLALVIGIVALRRVDGVYFAVLTLAFASLGYLVIGKIEAFGREDGLTGITRPDVDLGLASLHVSDSLSFYYLIVVVGALLTTVLWYATNSQFGRILKAIRQEPERAAFLGVNVQSFRLAAFVVAGAVTGMAAALLGPWSQIVTPELGHWVQSTKPILNAMLGGAGFFWGPALGAVLFAILTYMTRTLAGISELVTGGLLLVVVVAIPGGLMGLAQRLISRAKGDKRP